LIYKNFLKNCIIIQENGAKMLKLICRWIYAFLTIRNVRECSLRIVGETACDENAIFMMSFQSFGFKNYVYLNSVQMEKLFELWKSRKKLYKQCAVNHNCN
jgi:hypothetical protein